MKGLINLKNKDHVRLINAQNRNAERINKEDKKIAVNLNYSDIAFPLDINDYEKIEVRFQIQVNVLGYENKVCPLCISKKSYDQTLNLLLITEKDKFHYVFIKDFNRLMFSRTKHKYTKHYCMSCLQNFTTEELLSNHKKQYLLFNGCQAVKYEPKAIKFTNYNKQIPIISKIYADTECFLKRTNSYKGEHKIKYKEHVPNSICAKLVCLDDRFTLPLHCINKFTTWVLDKQKWTKQITKQYFNKILIMTSEDEEIYNNSHIIWICKQELNTDKVRDHFHLTGKVRGASLIGTTEVLHIIFKELNNFNVDIDVIPKGNDKYMSIIVNRHINFIDSLQFYNGSLDTLASNLKDEDFKYFNLRIWH